MTGPLGLGGLEAAEEDLLTEEAFDEEGVATGDALTEEAFVVEGVATGDALTGDVFVEEGVATGDALTEDAFVEEGVATGDATGDDVEAGNPGGTEGAEDLGFRPSLSLKTENSSSLYLAGLQDDQLNSCNLGSPLAYDPTLSSSVDLEGRELMGTGPLNFSDRDFSSPWFLK
jgi:hypothetical protein